MSKHERRDRYGYKLEIATRWADCDAYGHVNNIVYYSWFDTAVTRMMYERGVLSMEAPAIGLCVESRCEYFAPVAFPQGVEAGLRVAKIGTSSVRYEVGLFLQDEPLTVAKGHFVHVYVDRATRRPTALPERLRRVLEDLQ